MVRTDLVGTVVLIVGFADFTFQTGLDLSADADTVAYFAGCDAFPHADHFANYLVANAEREYI